MLLWDKSLDVCVSGLVLITILEKEIWKMKKTVPVKLVFVIILLLIACVR